MYIKLLNKIKEVCDGADTTGSDAYTYLLDNFRTFKIRVI